MNMNTVHEISRQRFQALTFSKSPMADFLAKEVEWWADKDERVLGTILIDRQDSDWNCIVLGRDELSLFRYIDSRVSFTSLADARNAIRAMMLEVSDSGQAVFEQGDATRKKTEILNVPPEREALLHKNFEILHSHISHQAAKRIIQEIAYAFVDLDGNFIEQFPTTGLNARLWELYLHAYFNEARFTSHRRNDRPDFEIEKYGNLVFVEGVTVNANADFDPPLAPATPAQIEELTKDFIPIKFGSPLFSKLQNKYWEMPHVKGHPLLIAIHDFHREDSMTWSSSGLSQYLYGARHRPFYDAQGRLSVVVEPIETHTYKTKTIPSGFFKQPGAENISGILFSNSATLGKFNRMGTLAGFGHPDVRLTRAGLCHDHDENARVPQKFIFEVKPDSCDESWGEGLSLFHNPNALNPVDPELFPNIAHHFFEDGKFVSVLPEFHPYNSLTHIMVIKR